MSKASQTKSELEAHLKRQVGFLQRSCAAYDEGFRDEDRRLAVAIRVILSLKWLENEGKRLTVEL